MNDVRLVFLPFLFPTAFPAVAMAADHQITMKSISYDPKVLTIKAGDELEWINKSYTEHSSTTKDDPRAPEAFDTGMVKPNKTSKKIKLSKPGTYNYHCEMHGKTMSGQIVVEP